MAFDLYFTAPYWQHILVTAVLVAAVAGVFGVFLVLRGLSLLGDGIAHVSLAGTVIALMAGLLPTATAVVWASLGALLIQEMRRRGVVKGDAAIGIIFTSSLAFAYLLVHKSHVHVDVEGYLFGNLYTSTVGDMNVMLGLAAAVVLVLLLLWRHLFAVTFNQEAAEVQGLPVRALDALFTMLAATAIVMTAQVVGVLLVSSLVIVPAATSLQFARGFRAALLLSPVIAVATVVVGLYLGDSFVEPPGASIAMTGGLVFSASLGIAGLIRRLRRARQPQSAQHHPRDPPR
ncbi:MAG: metal ABC transporter permease [Thermoplasmatota archaeon]